MDPDSSGQRLRARIVEMVDKHDHDVINHPERIKFLCKLDQNDRKELISYNQIMDYLNRDAENPTIWKYKAILSHQGPIVEYQTASYSSILILLILPLTVVVFQ